jgi:hypothetical protein
MLNTASNLGGTWPGFFVLRGIDYFTVATCNIKKQGSEVLIKGSPPRSDLEIYHTADIYLLQPRSASLTMERQSAKP